jgi:hypothetical protein
LIPEPRRVAAIVTARDRAIARCGFGCAFFASAIAVNMLLVVDVPGASEPGSTVRLGLIVRSALLTFGVAVLVGGVAVGQLCPALPRCLRVGAVWSGGPLGATGRPRCPRPRLGWAGRPCARAARRSPLRDGRRCSAVTDARASCLPPLRPRSCGARRTISSTQHFRVRDRLPQKVLRLTQSKYNTTLSDGYERRWRADSKAARARSSASGSRPRYCWVV